MSRSTPNPTITDLPPVRACIFDVDGLLINSEDIYTEIYNNILHEYGKPDYSWSVKARQQSRGLEGTRRLLKLTQLPLSPSEFNQKVASQHSLFQNTHPLPGVLTLLHTLSTQTSPPIHLALASSASPETFAIKTNHLPSIITNSFPVRNRVFGSDVAKAGKRGKPAPDIFLLALQRINEGEVGGDDGSGPPSGGREVRPAECLVFEDSTSGGREVRPAECLVFEDSIAGVEAARRAGMRVVWVPHPGLREVCRGWEDVVLAGMTEAGEGEGGAQEERREEEQRKEAKANPLSTDYRDVSGNGNKGWADLLTSLEDFSYERYGIHVIASK